MSKENRLRKKKDFEKVFKEGRNYKEGLLILKVARNDLSIPRFGMVVSHKVSKSAVVRNKLRRRLKNLTLKELKKEMAGEDFLLIALPGLEKKGFADLQETIRGLFKKTDNGKKNHS